MAEKLRGTKVWVPTPGGCAPRPAKRRAGCWRGSPPLAVRVRGYHPRKIFVNSDAKSCILATHCCELSCFLKTTAKKLGRPIHCWSRNPKVGGPVSPCPYVCWAYAAAQLSLHLWPRNVVKCAFATRMYVSPSVCPSVCLFACLSPKRFKIPKIHFT